MANPGGGDVPLAQHVVAFVAGHNHAWYHARDAMGITHIVLPSPMVCEVGKECSAIMTLEVLARPVLGGGVGSATPEGESEAGMLGEDVPIGEGGQSGDEEAVVSIEGHGMPSVRLRRAGYHRPG